MVSNKTFLGAATVGSLFYLLRSKESRNRFMNHLQMMTKPLTGSPEKQPNWNGYYNEALVPEYNKSPVTGLPYKGIPVGVRVG
ncbi:hypothetical protein [Mesobacillus zeae]|uniref:Uncharacterized protein n=1 Tax=Mesobacillus zeae TaxID=1917180 RepID=A0A398B879_9BACI|nr:hypothetical protein [Mesobacillus zeae]RID85701.1 hypothetical protein D1970_09130 [Mesobacillus zeae]